MPASSLISLSAWRYTETGGSSHQGSFKMILTQFPTQGTQIDQLDSHFCNDSLIHISIIILNSIFRQARHNKGLVDVVALPATASLLLFGMCLLYSFSRASGKKFCILLNTTSLKAIFSCFTASEFMQQMYNWTLLGPVHGILVPTYFSICFKDSRRNISRIFHSYILCRPYDCT